MTTRTIYEKILSKYNQKIYIESALIKDLNIIKNNIIVFNNSTNIYKNIFKQETNDEIYKQYGLIAESQINYNLSIINTILTCKNFYQITPIELVNSVKKQFKKEIKNNFPIYICKFSFSNNPEFWIKILDEFNIIYENKFEEIINFKKFQNNEGLSIPLGNIIILCLNLDFRININNIIYHELFHCLQIIYDKELDISNINISNYENGIFNLGLSKEDIQYLTTKKEFQTFIQVDLQNIIENLYIEYYYSKNISLKQFTINFLKDLKNNKINIFLSESYKKFKQSKLIKNKDDIAIRCFVMCFYLDNKTYLKEALNILLDF